MYLAEWDNAPLPPKDSAGRWVADGTALCSALCLLLVICWLRNKLGAVWYLSSILPVYPMFLIFISLNLLFPIILHPLPGTPCWFLPEGPLTIFWGVGHWARSSSVQLGWLINEFQSCLLHLLHHSPGAKTHTIVLAFMWVLGIQTHILMLA